MVTLSTKTVPKIYSLLSIGPRGAGKTVFLIASCIELYTNQYHDRGQQLWFDCEDSEVQQTLENILRQVAQTGAYPPATMRITNFDFSVKHRHFLGTKTLCQFRWWDPPGESCQIYNPAFLMMALNADGYCAFVDAGAVIKQAENSQPLSPVFEPVKSIADVIYSNHLKHPLAIIITKCDLLLPNSSDWQILEENLQSLKIFLDKLKIEYQIFYSAIPIVSTNEVSNFQTSEAAAPILWLVSQLRNSDSSNGSNGAKD